MHSFKNQLARLLVLTALTLVPSNAQAAQRAAVQAAPLSPAGLATPYLLKDTTPGTASSTAFGTESPLIQAGPALYFGASDSAGLSHLWRSDGTAAGTYAISGIESDYNNYIGSGVYPVGAVGNRVLVNVTNRVTSTFVTSLWVAGGPEGSQKLFTDLALVGVYPLKDGHSYALGSNGAFWRVNESPFSLTPSAPAGTTLNAVISSQVISNVLYYLDLAFHASQSDLELWRSDGTAAGTQRVSILSGNPQIDASADAPRHADIGGPGQPPPTLSQVAGKLFACYGNLMWGSDGTPGGTALIRNGNWAGAGCKSSAFKGKLFFADYDNTAGYQLWESDGSAAGTRPFINTAQPTPLKSTENLLFFSVIDEAYRTALWRTDGTISGTQQLKMITPSLSADGSIAFAGKLYFQADGQLWSSDGSVSGTLPVVSTDVLSNPSDFVIFNGQLVFFADNAAYGRELWISDGSAAGTHLIRDINTQGANSTLSSRYRWQNKVFFQSSVGLSGPFGLWVTDGSVSGTQHLLDSDRIYQFLGNGPSYAYFAKYYSSPLEIWRTDGTISNTSIITGIAGLSQTEISTLNIYDRLFFASGSTLWQLNPLDNDQISVFKQFGANIAPFVAGGSLWIIERDVNRLWHSDGTPAGTQLVADITDDARINDSTTILGTQLFFSVVHANSDLELWRSDGSAAGTQPITTLAKVGVSSYQPMVASAQYAYISTVTDSDSRIWRTDGLLTHTVQITAAASASSFYPMGSLADRAIFGEQITQPGFGILGVRLWSIADNQSNLESLMPPSLLPLQSLSEGNRVSSHLFYVVNGNQVWQTDGAITGTHKIYPPPGVAEPTTIFLQPSSEYVQLFGVTAGGPWSLWGSDGTQVQPLVDQVSVCLWGLGTLGPLDTFTDQALIFCAHDPATGDEPWAIALGASLALPTLSPAPLGNAINVHASIRNAQLGAPGPATLTATLPAGVTYLSDTLGLSPTVSGSTLVWQLPALAFGQRDFTLRLQAPNGTLGSRYPVTFSLSTTGNDANPADNTATTDIWLALQTLLPIALR